MKPPEFNAETHTCEFNGSKWVTTKIPEPVVEGEPQPPPDTYDFKRLREYGSTQSQLEFITENGLKAWQTKVTKIKAKFPKP